MKSNTLFKIVILGALLFVPDVFVRGQATLPFVYDGGAPGSAVPGLTSIGLGADTGSSPKMKFSTTGNAVILNFSGIPGTLSFNLKWIAGTGNTASRFPGDFTLQQSADGVTYTTVQLYNNTTGTALATGSIVTEPFTNLLTTSRFLKWVYTTRTNGNIYLGAINLAQGYTSFLTVSSNTISGFTYVATNGPSVEKSVTIGGNSLADNIVVTPPADYEISTGTGPAFVATNPITLTQSGGSVSATSIYTRLKQGLAAGNYNENISVASLNANTSLIACSGTVIPNPSITLIDITDPALATVKGTPVSQTLNVSGVNLNVDLGLAITGVDASLFSLSQYTVTQTGGNVPNTFVTITYLPTSVGNNTATLTMSSTGAMAVVRTLNGTAAVTTDVNVPAASLIVTAVDGSVLFNATAGESVEIFNSIGQKLVKQLAVEGQNTIPLTAHGVLLVKVGSRIGKVIL